MDYLPALLVASLLGLGLADPEPSLAAVNRVVQSFVHPSSSASASQPSYNAPSPSYSLAASYSKPKPAYGAPPEDKCYIHPSLNKKPSDKVLEIQQLMNITFTPDPCLDGPFNGNGTWTIEYLGARPEEIEDGESIDDRITLPSRKVEGVAHSYHYTNANKEPYFIMLEVNQLLEESFTPDEDEPYGHHEDHGRVKRQRPKKPKKMGKNKVKVRGKVPGLGGIGSVGAGTRSQG